MNLFVFHLYLLNLCQLFACDEQENIEWTYIHRKKSKAAFLCVMGNLFLPSIIISACYFRGNVDRTLILFVLGTGMLPRKESVRLRRKITMFVLIDHLGLKHWSSNIV